MSLEMLLACLNTLPRPEDIEDWVSAGEKDRFTASISADYRQAVQDMLTLLGAMSGGAYSSSMAYYFVRSLIASAQDKALTSASWQGRQGCEGFGASLVRLIESHRVNCLESPTPLRSVETVMAVIKARRGAESVYLMQYDKGAGQFQPIGGKREPTDPTNEAALTRELCEELEIASLLPGHDFNIRPLKEHAKINTVSASLNIITQYDHSFYLLTDIRFPLRLDSITRWITEAEYLAGKTTDGLSISKLIDEEMPGILPTLGYSLAEPIR